MVDFKETRQQRRLLVALYSVCFPVMLFLIFTYGNSMGSLIAFIIGWIAVTIVALYIYNRLGNKGV
ncbi:hypothetical protein BKG76_09050 [Mycobacteroides franklinii]|uniref:Uncharacterized protein n=1 Tax=Mycobacteroides franklinii TaxID=948102 RepID=A0A1S1L7F4_9MYCO|nr:hypothetical protein BKG76_09050 [Mycobacteroides franklinii]